MALVKMTRDTPEVPCGNTVGMFPEEAVAELKGKGWKIADKASEKVEPKKEEPKDPKVEPKFEEPKAPKFEEKKEFKDSKK